MTLEGVCRRLHKSQQQKPLDLPTIPPTTPFGRGLHRSRVTHFPQEVIRLETQYWSLVEVPRQEKTEPLPTFVLRACAVLERTKVSRDGAAEEEDEEKLDLIDRLGGQSTAILCRRD